MRATRRKIRHNDSYTKIEKVERGECRPFSAELLRKHNEKKELAK